MAQVTISVNGRDYAIACGDGEEEHLADLAQYVDKLEALSQDPNRKELRWQLDIDDDVLSDTVRQAEFKNWIAKVVLPRAAGA